MNLVVLRCADRDMFEDVKWRESEGKIVRKVPGLTYSLPTADIFYPPTFMPKLVVVLTASRIAPIISVTMYHPRVGTGRSA